MNAAVEIVIAVPREEEAARGLVPGLVLALGLATGQGGAGVRIRGLLRVLGPDLATGRETGAPTRGLLLDPGQGIGHPRPERELLRHVPNQGRDLLHALVPARVLAKPLEAAPLVAVPEEAHLLIEPGVDHPEKLMGLFYLSLIPIILLFYRKFPIYMLISDLFSLLYNSIGLFRLKEPQAETEGALRQWTKRSCCKKKMMAKNLLAGHGRIGEVHTSFFFFEYSSGRVWCGLVVGVIGRSVGRCARNVALASS